MNLLKRILVFAAAVLLISLFIRVARCDSFGGVPWPSHVVWTRYDVTDEDWHVVKPATPEDSVATKYVALDLPVGTQFYIPRRVPGWDPNGEAQRRMKEAAR